MSAIYYDARIDNKKLKGDIDQINRNIRGMSDNIKKEGSQLDKTFKGIGEGLKSMLPIASFATIGYMMKKIASDAYKFSNDFSMAMREVQTISQAVKADFEGLSEQIINLAANVPDDAITLSKAFYQIVSAGYDGAEGMELLRISAQAATAGLTDTKTAADGLTTILNAWGKSSAEAEKVADIMFKTVEKGKTTFPELASSIALVAPLAAAMKISFEEIAAAVATLTKQGNTTSMSMTQIRQAIIATNKVLGDGWQEAMSFQEALQKIRDMAQGSATELKKLVPENEALVGILGLTGEKAKEAAEDLDAMTTATGSMMSAYEKMMQEAENKWSLVHNKWKRELKELGDAIKSSSIDIADKLNELLTNREEDIIKPEVAGAITKFKAELDSLGDREQKIELIINKILALKDATLELGKEAGNLAKEQPGGLQKGIEAFNRGIGLNAQIFSPGLIKEEELQLVKDDIEVNNRVLTELSKLYQQVLTGGDVEVTTEKTKDKVEEKFKTLADSLSKIEELRSKLGTGTIEQDVQIYLKIANEQEFIDESFNKIRERLKEALRDNIELEPLSSLSTKNLINDKEIKAQLKPMKTLTAEEINRLKIQEKQLDALHKQQALYEDISKGFQDASEILGALSYAVGEFDRDLGESLGKMADLAYNASTLLTQMGAGNYVGAVASGIGILGNVFSLFGGQASYMGESLDNINTKLEQQNRLLGSLGGFKWFSLATKQLDDYQTAIEGAEKRLQSAVFLDEQGKIIRHQTKTLEEFIDAYLNGNIKFYDATREILFQAIDDQKAIIDLQAEMWDKVTGTTSDAIADSVIEGFRNGARSAEDFADNFEELMQTAVINALKTQMIEGELSKWYKNFYEVAKDGLTANEIKEQERLWENFITTQRTAYDMMKEVTGLDLSFEAAKPEGLSGAIKGITEETAGIIAGQFMAMREIGYKTYLTGIEQLDVMNQSVTHLAKIEENTKYNVHLAEMRDTLNSMNSKIQRDL